MTREKTLGSDSLKIEKMKQDRVSELEKCEDRKEMPRLVFKVMFRGSRCTLDTRTPSLSVLLCDGLRGTYHFECLNECFTYFVHTRVSVVFVYNVTIHVSSDTCRGQRRNAPPASFQTGSLTEPGPKLVASKPQ